MQAFEKEDLCCEVIRVGILGTNCYVCYNKSTKEGCVIDPGGEVDKIMAFINSKEIKVQRIYLTHGHFDHIMVAGQLKEKTGAPIAVFECEKELMESANSNCSYMVSLELDVKADILLHDKENVPFAGKEAVVINTPGHTKGSVCYYLEEDKVLFSGDTLFFESYGRTDLPTGSMGDMVRSLKDILFELPEDVAAYPGHGAFTDIGYEKNNMEI